ncbi:MAG: hypothetical protein K2O18_06755, partial [Oscillospiraceae bacterium]|nr:hypothetical protein [Oscillospiraceae bacterium]
MLLAERQAKQAAKENRRANSDTRPDSKSPDVPGDRLAEAARALAKKMQKDTREDEDGQITLDFTAASAQPQQEYEQAAEEQETKTIVTERNYEVTVRAEEAPLLTRLLADKEIDTAQFVHSNGDITFSFAASVKDDVERLIAQSRAELAAAHPAAKSSKTGRTKVELNYRSFVRQFPEIASGEYRYLCMEAGKTMMPLHLEWTGRDEIAVSHTYTLNGDLMRDPEMTFRVDREKGTLEPLTFRQDGSIPIYQQVYPEPGRWIPKLRNDLNSFAQQWLKNISEQNYHKHEAVVERDGEDVRLSFDQDGNAVEPVAASAAENTAGDHLTVKEIYEHYAPIVKNLVLADDAYRNACVNSDQDLAHLEGNEAVKRAVLAVNEPVLMKQYYDNTAFHNRLHQEIVSETYPTLSQSQQEQAAEAQETSAAWAVTPVALYEDAVRILDGAVKNSSLYHHLRDRDLDYDSAAEALNAEMPQLMEAAKGYPDIMAAYQSLPMFREWLVEDILERNYQDVVTDQRLAPERYANSPDAPEWVRNSPVVDNSEPERAGDDIETPPAAETVPESTGAGVPEQPENTAVQSSRTGFDERLLSPPFKVGDTAYLWNSRCTISKITPSEIEVQLRDQNIPLRLFRIETIEQFEYLLRQDPRNKQIVEYLSADINQIRDDIREILTAHPL